MPRIRAEDWKLRVHGMVDRELNLNYNDLRGRDLVVAPSEGVGRGPHVRAAFVERLSERGIDARVVGLCEHREELALRRRLEPARDIRLRERLEDHVVARPGVATKRLELLDGLRAAFRIFEPVDPRGRVAFVRACCRDHEDDRAAQAQCPGFII